MSLDVALLGNKIEETCYCCGNKTIEREEIFSQNITHNLGKMASEVGIYKILWRPLDNGFTKAEDIAYKLDVGIKKLKADPDKYKSFNAPDGWGTYDQFIPWLEEYLEALKDNPDAEIAVSV